MKDNTMDEAWDRYFIEACKDNGHDPWDCADSMLRIAMLRVEHLRASQLVSAQLAAAAGFFAQRTKADHTVKNNTPLH
jgi:hypothetical protein